MVLQAQLRTKKRKSNCQRRIQDKSKMVCCFLQMKFSDIGEDDDSPFKDKSIARAITLHKTNRKRHCMYWKMAVPMIRRQHERGHTKLVYDKKTRSYKVMFKCPKDEGDKCKECHQWLPISVLFRPYQTGDPIPESMMFELMKVKEMIRNSLMERLGIATSCPKNGCIYNEMFQIPKRSQIIYCPNHKCFTNNKPTSWCKLCRASPAHSTLITCEEYKKRSKQTIPAYLKKITKKCPGCGMHIVKKEGCDKITCVDVGNIKGCGTSFCYTCGVILGGPDEHSYWNPTTSRWEQHLQFMSNSVDMYLCHSRVQFYEKIIQSGEAKKSVDTISRWWLSVQQKN